MTVLRPALVRGDLGATRPTWPWWSRWRPAETRRYDRLLKPAVYAAAGIPAYWRVEPGPVLRHATTLDGREATGRCAGRGRRAW